MCFGKPTRIVNRIHGFNIPFRYIANLNENAEEGTKLLFEGGLDRVEDLDKVEYLCFLNRSISFYVQLQ